MCDIGLGVFSSARILFLPQFLFHFLVVVVVVLVVVVVVVVVALLY